MPRPRLAPPRAAPRSRTWRPPPTLGGVDAWRPGLTALLAVLATALGPLPRAEAAPPPGTWRMPTYTVTAPPGTGALILTTPAGAPLTRLPVFAGPWGPDWGAAGVVTMDRLAPRVLRYVLQNGAGTTVAATTVTIAPQGLFLTFDGLLDPTSVAPMAFFTDGDGGGITLPSSYSAFAPVGDMAPAPGLPGLDAAAPSPLAPPPLDLQVQLPGGWLGTGLVTLPDATTMDLIPNGSVMLNMPQAAGCPEQAPTLALASGSVGPLCTLATFVVTVAANPWQGLTRYGLAVSAATGLQPAAPPGSQPAWWHWPLVDTWGQQVVDRAIRTSPAYTTAWVQAFVRSWRAAYGLDHFTVVIDADWQAGPGQVTPSGRFGGTPGLQALIAGLHRAGLRVVLWYPLWRGPLVLGPTQVMTTVPATTVFADELSQQMQFLLGHGPQDLGADGLKVDWAGQMPDPAQASALGADNLGVLGLWQYLGDLYRAAKAVAPGAMVDTSAASPQFQGMTDLVRLYDASDLSQWTARARVVTSADPGMLIDGDQWSVPADQAVAQAVQSVIYGTAASYFASTWGDGTPIALATARLIGAIYAAGAARRQGVARFEAGVWQVWQGSELVAETLPQDAGLVLFTPGAAPFTLSASGPDALPPSGTDPAATRPP